MADSQPPSASRLFRWLWAVAIAACLFNIAKYGFLRPFQYADSLGLMAYYKASSAILDGRIPYDFPQEWAIYCYPLFLAIVMSPLATLPFGAARVVWYAGTLAAIGLLLALVFAWMRRRLAASPPSEHAHIRLRARVAALFCAGFVPILYTLVDGMIDLWLTLGVMAAIFWALDGRKALAGALLGVAIVTKIAPVLWLPGFALLLGWRGAAAAIGVAFGYEAAIWAAGWGPWEVHLVTHVLPKWPYLPQLPSFSLYHIALHWSARFGAGEAESAAWGARALMAGRVAASACYAYVLWRVWQVWRQGREGGRDGQIEAKNNDDVSENPDIRNPAHPLWPAALAMLASFYLSPLMEPNHLIWLAAPVAGVLLEGRGPLRARDIGLVVAVWALGLLCYELTQTMNLWWGFQVAFAAPILAALLFLPRPSQKNDASTGEANPQGPKGIYSSS